MSFPMEIKEIEEETNQNLLRDFPVTETKCWLQIGPKKFVVPSKYHELGPELYNFKLRPDDIWIVTFPRSGATVTQEMMWLIVKDLDFEGSIKIPQFLRFPQIEHKLVVSDELREKLLADANENPAKRDLIEQMTQDLMPTLEQTQEQRFMKTHLPLSLLPPGLLETCKVVYVCRHPKDVIVSFYQVSRNLSTISFQNDFEHFWDYIENSQCCFCPYWGHLREAWEQRDHPNMLFLFYEDIVKDMHGQIRKIANHYGKQMTEAQVRQLANHLKIENVRKNKIVNLEAVTKISNPETPTVKEGNTAGLKDYFTPELNVRADSWITDNMARLPGFTFPVNK
ncbi:hypothetical protein B566_EDAN008413 [Ephemera danica]|nr:hypothetical protein B566_EDAN008413 [Ephemera danica]